jgi:1,4-alpha-glucan branching enzyme
VASGRQSVLTGVSLLTDQDLHLFNEGTHLRLYEKLGSHPIGHEGDDGTYFAVWAPNAEAVSVIGDFNKWQADCHPLSPRASSGIWEGFIPGVGAGSRYKYRIRSRHQGYVVDKADPFALRAEEPPATASIVWGRNIEWADGEWMTGRPESSMLDGPTSIYEVHIGSWRRDPGSGRWLSYAEVAPLLTQYVKELGFTHVEFLPVMEHPFYGSWGYQATGYFAVSSRWGTPQDFAFLVDHLHREGIGVVLDWVPSHFPDDEHGLAFFDGTHLYEHSDPRQGRHPDWDSCVFNYERNEVRSFLLSNAMFWLDHYHADALRVDAVASMLYLDYSRAEGKWVPNRYGGNENLAAIDFLRRLNTEAYGRIGGIQVIAEESTAWPMVTRPVNQGGLGFGLKWDMGWMHDTLDYMSKDPAHRKYQHQQLTFRMLYAFSENFILALSHDEVVHLKGSLFERMPGDDWQKAANLRLLLTYMWTQPGKKLLFMGGEFGQRSEWDHESSLDWPQAEAEPHRLVRLLVRDLNTLYSIEPALHAHDLDATGFEWISADDADSSVIAYLRRSDGAPPVLVICNFTPVVRHGYRLGIPEGGWEELLNSDSPEYGGSGVPCPAVTSEPTPMHGRPHSIALDLPPLGALVLRQKA